ncbi:MAG: hypothetical protein ACLSHC_17845 [Bilophila wadsworthia]
MRTKTPFRRKRLISRGSSSSTSVEVKVERELQCSRCKAIFPTISPLPECGGEVDRPRGGQPLYPDADGTFLACGHLLWLVGTISFSSFWQTDSGCGNHQAVYHRAFLLLFCSVLFSAAYFGIARSCAASSVCSGGSAPSTKTTATINPEATPSSTSSPSAACRLRFAY